MRPLCFRSVETQHAASLRTFKITNFQLQITDEKRSAAAERPFFPSATAA
jgi:hypothetical protein